MFLCKFCKRKFDFIRTTDKANHVRWCDLNPKKNYNWNKNSINAMNESKRKSGFYNDVCKAKILKTSIKSRKGIHRKKGIKHSEETKKKLSILALNSSHRRINRKIIIYTKKNGEIVKLDSSWEEKLAMRLDYLNIEWIRPDPIKWFDGKVTRNYFPDFYLTKYDIYLDPKNPVVYKLQKIKIEWLNKNVKNLFFLKTLSEIENFSIPIYAGAAKMVV